VPSRTPTHARAWRRTIVPALWLATSVVVISCWRNPSIQPLGKRAERQGGAAQQRIFVAQPGKLRQSIDDCLAIGAV
jgi:hypothetical protein